MKYTYDEFIQLLNSDGFSCVIFEIEGYAHYRNCVIKKVHRPILNGAAEFDVILSNDPNERIWFFKTFNEKCKLFYFGRNRSFTLKQIWDRVVIREIQT